MKGFKLRPGDMVTAAANTAVITKVTPNYLYYYLHGRISRVRKTAVWEAYDLRSDVSLHYGTSTNRRRQKRMRHLDLHGINHQKADDEIRKFLNFVELPCKIVTGNSDAMKKFVEAVVLEYGWQCHEESAANPGTLIVIED
tara:strand:- start:402 stop:824 length:423 start_codon:yes stop_codon:yes gene_type:complete